MKELVSIQSELKCPKGQMNKFGGYRYRSCEDIMEAVKPVMAKYNCHLTVSDDMDVVCGRVYIRAIATLTNSAGEKVTVSAFAREPETKKGMDDSQITGAASSYARKYALNGLFCIDDTKDADATNTHGKEEKPSDKGTAPVNEQIAFVKKNYTAAQQKKICDKYDVSQIEELDSDSLTSLIGAWKKKNGDAV